MNRIRILIVDDHEIVRMGLVTMLDEEPDMTVVAQAGTGEEGVALYQRDKPDVVLMDLRLPGMSGAEAIAAMRKHDPDAKVIVLTTYDTDEDVFRALKAGARGYLLKATFRGGVLEAIRGVHAGQRVIPPDVAARLAERMDGPELTAQEVAILELVAKGLTNQEIGKAVALAEYTIKNKMKRIFAKLDVTDRSEAVYVAVQRGLIRADKG
jgi:two-component system NarL family response regulator